MVAAPRSRTRLLTALGSALFCGAQGYGIAIYSPLDGSAHEAREVPLRVGATIPDDAAIADCTLCISLDVFEGADGGPRGAPGGELSCLPLEAMATEEVVLRELLPGSRRLLLELKVDGAVVAQSRSTFVVGGQGAVDITAAVASWNGTRAGQSADGSTVTRAAYFGAVYETEYWSARGTMRDTPRSGPGSTIDAAANARATLEMLARELELEVIVDVPCGDVHWMRHVDLPARTAYVGADIVSDVIESNRKAWPQARFLQLDVVNKGAPAVLRAELAPFGPRSLINCRHLLFHLSPADASLALAHMTAAGAGWLLTSTYVRADDLAALGRAGYILASGHRVNLLKPPFCARDPVRLYLDSGRDQYLGLWDLSQGPLLGDCDAQGTD
ncbi:hypothetical protein M885DRAFT_548925 [Pelagophyceae sp. CCMP2097]|nr:hypothetical protein M885DRAFT_548925 [Pelagophyceae sp. CCMP2097]|mmetsp:Transcript_10859/g.36229  ORF Transcript_10859/g.36229 Transcript_10859/m.36229 type:complete len:387 (+) Transcript_10859:147-1307(+)